MTNRVVTLIALMSLLVAVIMLCAVKCYGWEHDTVAYRMMEEPSIAVSTITYFYPGYSYTYGYIDSELVVITANTYAFALRIF